MTRVTVNLDPEQAALLKARAADTGVPQSEQIRRALASALARPHDRLMEQLLTDAVEVLGASKELADDVRSGRLPFEALRVDYIKRASANPPPLMFVKRDEANKGKYVLVAQPEAK